MERAAPTKWYAALRSKPFRRPRWIGSGQLLRTSGRGYTAAEGHDGPRCSAASLICVDRLPRIVTFPRGHWAGRHLTVWRTAVPTCVAPKSDQHGRHTGIQFFGAIDHMLVPHGAEQRKGAHWTPFRFSYRSGSACDDDRTHGVALLALHGEQISTVGQA